MKIILERFWSDVNTFNGVFCSENLLLPVKPYEYGKQYLSSKGAFHRSKDEKEKSKGEVA